MLFYLPFSEKLAFFMLYFARARSYLVVRIRKKKYHKNAERNTKKTIFHKLYFQMQIYNLLFVQFKSCQNDEIIRIQSGVIISFLSINLRCKQPAMCFLCILCETNDANENHDAIVFTCTHTIAQANSIHIFYDGGITNACTQMHKMNAHTRKQLQFLRPLHYFPFPIKIERICHVATKLTKWQN